MRVYLQVQQWMGNPSQLQSTEWGWLDKGGRYFPVLTDKAAAPPNLLKIIRCNCKWDVAVDSVHVELMDLNVPTHVAYTEVFAQMFVQFMKRLKETRTSKSNM